MVKGLNGKLEKYNINHESGVPEKVSVIWIVDTADT